MIYRISKIEVHGDRVFLGLAELPGRFVYAEGGFRPLVQSQNDIGAFFRLLAPLNQMAD